MIEIVLAMLNVPCGIMANWGYDKIKIFSEQHGNISFKQLILKPFYRILDKNDKQYGGLLKVLKRAIIEREKDFLNIFSINIENLNSLTVPSPENHEIREKIAHSIETEFSDIIGDNFRGPVKLILEKCLEDYGDEFFRSISEKDKINLILILNFLLMRDSQVSKEHIEKLEKLIYRLSKKEKDKYSEKTERNRKFRKIRKNITSNILIEPFVEPGISFGQKKTFLGKNPDIFHVLAGETRLIILGEIGSGKTTICFRYAADKETLKKYRMSLVIPLCFYKSGEGLLSLICQAIESFGVDINIIDLKYLLKGKKRRLSFIFDGFNEIPRHDRDTFIWDVERLCALYTRHQVVVTSRPEFYNHQLKNFKEIKMLPWNEFQVKKYLKLAVESENTINDFLAKSRLNYERCGLLSRPFFVIHLVREYKKSGELPDNRKVLLDCIVRRRFEEFIIDEKGIGFSSDIKCCLSNIAFSMQKDYAMIIDTGYAKEIIMGWFSSRGGKEVFGYEGVDLWKNVLNSGFLRYNERNISFLHEIWQDYFTSLYLELALKDGDGEVMKLLTDTWWNEVFLYFFNYAPEKKVADILSKAWMNNNIELISYALKREAGAKSNRASQAFVSSLLITKNILRRDKIYSVMAGAKDNPWCIRMLLDCIDEEQKILIKNGDESKFYNRPVSSVMPGYRPYNALVFERNSFFTPMPADAIEEILEVKHRAPFARLAATKLLAGTVGILNDSILIDILEERSKDKFCWVREAVVDVIEIVWWHNNAENLRKSLIYPKMVSILKSIKTQHSIRILLEMEEIDNSKWINDSCDLIWGEVEKAIEQGDPKMGYRLISNRFEDIVGDPEHRVFEMLCDEEKRLLLRLTVDHVLEKREKLEKSKKELDSITPSSSNKACEGKWASVPNLSEIDPNFLMKEADELRRIFNTSPELLWEYFDSVIFELGKVANGDDIWRFKVLLAAPPVIWDNHYFGDSNKIKIAWVAAKGLVRIGDGESKKALKDLLSAGNESSVIAALALVLGENQEKWETSPNDFIFFRNSIKKMNNGTFFYIFILLLHEEPLYYERKDFCRPFFKKFGIERTLVMLRDALENDTRIALEFIEKCDFFPIHNDLKGILKDQSKSEYYERVKHLLRTMYKGIL